jgi:signal transduction histidine kinase/ligand-binding sensor domain-containing protein
MHLKNCFKNTVCSLIFVFIAIAGKAQYLQQPYGMGISNLHIQSIVQDSLGYIWMATARGLDRMDGYQQSFYFKNADDNHSLTTDNVTRLFVTRKDELYVFTNDGMINIYNRPTNNFIRVKGLLSNSSPSCTEDDATGTVWAGYYETLYYLDRQFNQLRRVENFHLNLPITNLCRDDNGYMWMNLGKNNVVVFNPRLRRIIAQFKINNLLQLFRGPQINTLYGITSDGVVLINAVTHKVIYSLSSLKGHVIEKSGLTADRRLYYLTDDLQLYIYDKKSKSFSARKIEGINNVFNVTSVYIDRQSNILIGTFEEGYKVIPFVGFNFNIDRLLSDHFNNKFVTYLTGDRNSRIWVATRHEGLQEFNRKSGTTRVLLNIPMSSEESTIACCYYDSQKRLWVATYGGVYYYQTNPSTSLKGKYNIRGARYITEDRQGNIWVAAYGNKGIWMIPKSSKNIKLTDPFPKLNPSSNVTYIMQLKSGKYLFSSFADNVFIGDINGTFKPLFPNNPAYNSFLRSVIYIYEDSKGIIWLGTYGNGLMRYDIARHHWQIFTMQDGLPSNDVLAITQDKEGFIWMSTSFGLSKIIGSSFINYFTKNGLLGNQYHERSVYSYNDILYFTGNHGITSFRPETIHTSNENIPLIIESIASDERTYFAPNQDSSDKLRLSYKENSFTVSFLGFDYPSSNNLQYSYILEGFDKHWSVPSATRLAKFSNIPSGKYVFRVRVCNNEGRWNDKIVELKIIIPPAPWVTWWAILIYIIIIFILLYKGLQFYINYKVDKEKMKMSEATLQKERDLNQAKINFFENISHELRTPVGLIYGPFCELSKQKGFSKKQNMYMSLIGSNIERLMTLVEQILNFSHLDSETLSLRVKELDIVALVWKIMKRFQGENKAKHIEVSFSTKEEQLNMLVDDDKLDKILSNLLSNAFKYTSVNGKIEVSLKVLSSEEVQKSYDKDNLISSKYMQLSVKDNGIGVAKDELDKIFDRFYRSKMKDNASTHGNGIGLYYIKCLTIKHKGFIKAELNSDKGMTFKFCLPMDAVYSSSEIADKADIQNLIPNEKTYDWSVTPPDETNDEDVDEEENKDKPQLLILEDEPNLQQFLETLLTPYYQITKAFDGSDGLDKAFTIIPDIILTDVMMPLLNGYQFCSKVKSDMRTCHIPVIMLDCERKCR